MTTRSIFWRLFWKEYRLQRALWIAMLALTTMVMLAFFASFSERDRPVFLFWTAAGLPAMYFLGCGASLFAGEREAGTYEFQRALPVGAWRVFMAKIAYAVASAAMLFGLMSLLAFYLTGWALHPPQGFFPPAVILFGVLFGLDMLLWVTLFSLLSKRVLVAGILGVVATSVHLELAGNLFQVFQGNYASLPAVVAVALAVMLTDCAWGFNWFREKQDRRSRSVEAHIASELPAQTAPSFDHWLRASQWTILRRLAWQHWRQSWRTMAVILAMLIPLSVMSVEGFRKIIRLPETGRLDLSIDPISYLAAFLILASVPLLGTTAFMADQRRRGFRFLTDRGVPPKRVWLSRLVILFAICVLAAVILLVVNLAGSVTVMKMLDHFARDSVQDVISIAWKYAVARNAAFLALGYVVLGLAAGQFCSMFLRSSLLAGLFSIVLTAILVAWCALMWFWGVPWLWSVVPIPVVLLLATRLRTRDWLLERNTPRAWLRPAVAMFLPAAALFVAVPAYRVYTIPDVDPGFSVEEFNRAMTPEEKATFDLYQQALINTIKLPHCSPCSPNCFEGQKKPVAPTAQESAWIDANHAWVDANQKTIAQAMKASRGKLFNPTGKPLNPSYPFTQSLYELAQLLICSAERLEDQGKLDEAFNRYAAVIRIAVHLRDWQPMPITMEDYYDCRNCNPDQIEAVVYKRLPRWAARPGQTPERIIAATRQLEQLTAGSSSVQGIKLAYRWMELFLLAPPSAADGYFHGVPNGTMIWNRLPWERARALRMLNEMTQFQIRIMNCAEKQARSGEQIIRRYPRPEEIISPWSEYLDYPYALRRQINVPPILYGMHYEMVQEFAVLETSRRGTRLVMAIEAWKLRHGSLPKKLDELVGSCIDRMPVDPYSGRPFRYFPEGIKTGFSWESKYPGGRIAANQPFLWSGGQNLDLANMRDSNASDCDSQRPRSEEETLQSGWPFPIP